MSPPDDSGGGGALEVGALDRLLASDSPTCAALADITAAAAVIDLIPAQFQFARAV
jgi:hypothetical protein